ncbi:MAG: VWA domain-containing protein [Legionella sp.]|nr:VWA domain-containing protein [Legionella sp.]
MNYPLHFLRPAWFFALIPLGLLAFILLRQKAMPHALKAICDQHLLPHLIQTESLGAQKRALLYLLSAALFMILSLTGPTWKKLPTPTYHAVHPRLVLMDLSADMLKQDIKPNRLTRAKFKLHDLFQPQNKGQFGLIVYTSEPFVVSPLTLDAQTIDALINQLEPNIMPVGGSNLADALQEGKKLIKQSNVSFADFLVLTGTPPSKAAIEAAKKLSQSDIQTSILALNPSKVQSPAFEAFAKAGNGENIHFSHTEKDIQTWLSIHSRDETFQANLNHTLPVWRDDGRWLLVPALLCLLPVFRRAWLMRIAT